MTRYRRKDRPDPTRPRGWCGIGIYRVKCAPNVGTVWRSAREMRLAGCSLFFTVGDRLPEGARINAFRAVEEMRQRTDTMKAVRHVPWLDFPDVEALRASSPAAQIVGVEIDDRAIPLPDFCHPERAIYLLGAEDFGIRPADRLLCDHIVQIPGANLNVAVAGSIVLYDRLVKREWVRTAE